MHYTTAAATASGGDSGLFVTNIMTYDHSINLIWR